MTAPGFYAWPKTPRLFRDVTVTEKIDGTNGCIVVTDDGEVWAQSRTRILHPPCDDYPDGIDNHGFRVWVDEHRTALAHALGVGRHYGEWWGQGIQRKYGLTHKRFSLFNVSKWRDANLQHFGIPGLGMVPILWEGRFTTEDIDYQVDELCTFGSQAAPGFLSPEGIVIWSKHWPSVFKVLCENDEVAKSYVVKLDTRRVQPLVAVQTSLDRRAA